MIAEYQCIKRCFFNNSLHEVGVVVIADDKDMKGNPCFKKVPSKKPETAEKVEK